MELDGKRKIFCEQGKVSRCSAVGTVTGYGLRGWSSSPGRPKNFHFSLSFRPAMGPMQPPIQWVLEVLSQGVKWQVCEADQ